MQGPAILGVERSEELLLHALADRAQLPQRIPAFRRHGDEVPPPVVAVALAHDVTALLEVVEQPDELAAVHPSRSAIVPCAPQLPSSSSDSTA